MEIYVERKYPKDKYTIGYLYINTKSRNKCDRFCDTLEDKVVDKNKNGKFDNGEKKVYGESAIPYGRYRISLDYSPKFSAKSAYSCFLKNGRMPHICDVPHFEGILIHGGNTVADTFGCLLVGKNTIKGQLTSSLATFKELYKKIVKAIENGESVYITYE